MPKLEINVTNYFQSVVDGYDVGLDPQDDFEVYRERQWDFADAWQDHLKSYLEKQHLGAEVYVAILDGTGHDKVLVYQDYIEITCEPTDPKHPVQAWGELIHEQTQDAWWCFQYDGDLE